MIIQRVKKTKPENEDVLKKIMAKPIHDRNWLGMKIHWQGGPWYYWPKDYTIKLSVLPVGSFVSDNPNKTCYQVVESFDNGVHLAVMCSTNRNIAVESFFYLVDKVGVERVTYKYIALPNAT